MPYVAATPLPPQVLDANGDPLANGTLEFYLTGTSTATPVYSDDSGTSLGATVTLNARGEPQNSGGTAVNLYYNTSIVYKIVRKDSSGSTIAPTIDPFVPSGSFAPITPLTYGALGDKTTDCLSAFDSALAAAYTAGRALYIPGLAPGFFYKISDTWSIQDRDDVHIFGDGTGSLILNANTGGSPAIQVNSTTHASMSRLGITGVSGSGHGIEQVSASHHNTFSDIWIGWVDGDGFKNTQGISTRLTNVSIDQNNGYRPASLSGTGLTEGQINKGIYVPYDATGLNNDFNCVDCQVNAGSGSGSTDYSVQIGDSSGRVDSFKWLGGLIQGAQNYKAVYLKTLDGVIEGAHIEPPVGATSNYLIEFDTCKRTVVKDCSVQGDVKFTGACEHTGLENVTMSGADISSTSVRPYIKNATYNNIQTGPTSGQIIDRSGQLQTENVFNASDARFDSVLNMTDETNLYFSEKMEVWDSDSSPSRPARLNTIGSPTLTRESTTVYSGTYSAKLVTGGTIYADGLAFNTPEVAHLAGRRIYIDCRVYVETADKKAYLYANWNSGAVVKAVGSQQTGTWERLRASFKFESGDTSFVCRLTGDASTTFYIDEVRVWIDGYTPLTFKSISDTATPDISAHGNESCYAPPTVHLAGTTTVTNILGMVPGEPVTFVFNSAKTINTNSNIKLRGGANLNFNADDCVILVKDPVDGVIKQVCYESGN